MTVHTGIGDIAADVAYLLLASGLGCAVRGSSYIHHFFGESNPIGIIHRNGLAVFTTTPWRQHQGRRLGQRNRRIIDDFPSGIEIATPHAPVETARSICSIVSLFLLSRIVRL